MSATANQINNPLVKGSTLERIHSYILGNKYVSQSEILAVFPDMTKGGVSKGTTRLRELGLAKARKVVKQRAKWYRGIAQDVFLNPPQNIVDIPEMLEKQMIGFNDEADRKNIDPPDVRNIPQGSVPSLVKEVPQPLTGKPINPSMVLKKVVPVPVLNTDEKDPFYAIMDELYVQLSSLERLYKSLPSPEPKDLSLAELNTLMLAKIEELADDHG